MPQLDFASYGPQLIWLAITFAILYLVMARIALPGVGGVIEQRRNRIASDLDEANQLRGETEKSDEAYRATLAEARAKAHGLGQETRQKLNGELEAERAKVDAELAEKLKEAEARIGEMKAGAMSGIKDVATESATEIVKELVGGRIAKTTVSKAVDQVAGK